MNEVRVYENFVFAAVKGDYGKEILSFYQYAVLIDVKSVHHFRFFLGAAKSLFSRFSNTLWDVAFT